MFVSFQSRLCENVIQTAVNGFQVLCFSSTAQLFQGKIMQIKGCICKEVFVMYQFSFKELKVLFYGFVEMGKSMTMDHWETK
jgi:hypothetical protein